MNDSEIIVFAEKVEALCGFLLETVTKDGSPDVVALQKLQEEAADFASGTAKRAISLAGIAEVLR